MNLTAYTIVCQKIKAIEVLNKGSLKINFHYFCIKTKKNAKKKKIFLWLSIRVTDSVKCYIFLVFKMLIFISGIVYSSLPNAVYLTSPGRPTDIGLQLGKACYPCSG